LTTDTNFGCYFLPATSTPADMLGTLPNCHNLPLEEIDKVRFSEKYCRLW